MTKTQKYFYEQHESVRGRPYNANFGKDGAIFKRLEKLYGVEWVKHMIDYYIRWEDPFIKQAGYTVGIFQIKVNALVDKVRKPIEREAAPPQKTNFKEYKEPQGFSSSREILSEIMKGANNGSGCQVKKV